MGARWGSSLTPRGSSMSRPAPSPSCPLQASVALLPGNRAPTSLGLAADPEGHVGLEGCIVLEALLPPPLLLPTAPCLA